MCPICLCVLKISTREIKNKEQVNQIGYKATALRKLNETLFAPKAILTLYQGKI